jgi:hypothetical protein
LLAQHKNSSPRLDDFKEWRLDEADHVARPSVVARREKVLELRKKRESPVFSRMWSGLSEEGVPGPVDGLRFVVEGDPLFAWRGGSESWWRLRMCDRA